MSVNLTTPAKKTRGARCSVEFIGVNWEGYDAILKAAQVNVPRRGLSISMGE